MIYLLGTGIYILVLHRILSSLINYILREIMPILCLLFDTDTHMLLSEYFCFVMFGFPKVSFCLSGKSGVSKIKAFLRTETIIYSTKSTNPPEPHTD